MYVQSKVLKALKSLKFYTSDKFISNNNYQFHANAPIFTDAKINRPQMSKVDYKAYWRENLKYLVVLLSIWFLISFGAGIIFKENLDLIKIGGFPLGFWFAHQGAIYGFIILIFVYVRLMKLLVELFVVL